LAHVNTFPPHPNYFDRREMLSMAPIATEMSSSCTFAMFGPNNRIIG
jgi:hypothetical protein